MFWRLIGQYLTKFTGLTKRFEPECWKELYKVEFQGKRKWRSEDWAAYAENLKMLVEKAYTAQQAEAQEPLVLDHFLIQIENPKVVFGVVHCPCWMLQ